ncbi:hypothetical protein HMPREF3038_02836 [Akkermansia sp. KLE1797]|nr:hypothetical protein HMPREF3038_02836 [Akkermansia sp. KLE1797]KXU52695.1 hypothetical protein HMPREF3039_03220 [Akkermansia sp. KLE1798]KZA04121.1 hypothetical protein HMPREF1326_02319 [Akkermansia sp. KLE1605]
MPTAPFCTSIPRFNPLPTGSVQGSARDGFNCIQHESFLTKELSAAAFSYLFQQNRQRFFRPKNSESGLRQRKEK